MLHTSQQGIITGLWEATAGTYHVIYSKYEFISLLQGKIVITPDGGDPVVVQAGDAFAVEATFVGTWEILEDVKKYFLIAPKAV